MDDAAAGPLPPQDHGLQNVPIRGSDLDPAQRLVQGMSAVADLVDAACDLHGVRPDRLSTLIALLTEPLEGELASLAQRADRLAISPV